MNNRAEDDGRDQHLDQPDESIAQRFERFAEAWRVMPEEYPGKHSDQDLHVEDSIPRSAQRRG